MLILAFRERDKKDPSNQEKRQKSLKKASTITIRWGGNREKTLSTSRKKFLHLSLKGQSTTCREKKKKAG